jgi:hypothetical protein
MAERAESTVTNADGVIVGRTKAQIMKAAQEYEIAIAFLYNVDQKRYGSMIKGLENSYQLGCDEYPRNLQAAYSLLSGWKPEYEPNTGPTEGLVCTTEGGKGPRKNKDHIEAP